MLLKNMQIQHREPDLEELDICHILQILLYSLLAIVNFKIEITC